MVTPILETMKRKYNEKTDIMVKRWLARKGVIAERWREGIAKVLGTDPDPTFVEAIKKGVEAGAPKYSENIKGKGEKLVRNYYEKLTGKLFA